jgi:PAS domain S-box-containing protein
VATVKIDEIARLERRLQRERAARIAAENLLESKSTELYDALERLRQEVTRAQALSDAAGAAKDGIALTDAEGIFTYMNAAHAELFGYEPDELIGLPWSALYSDETAAEIAAVAVPVVFAEGGWRGEVTGLSKQGTPVEQEVTLTAKPDQLGLICITRDARPRKEREAQAKELERRMRMSEQSIALFVLSNTVAHDLGNLVAIIEGNAVVLENLLADGEAKDRVGRICMATNAAREVLESLEAGVDADMMDRREIDLSAFLRNTAGLLEAIKPRGVTLQLDVPASARALVNEVSLSRAVLNIVKNAFEAMEEHGGVDITLKEGGRSSDTCSLRLGTSLLDAAWTIDIRDHGPGFRDGDLESYFKPFASTKKRSQVSGLGLLSVSALAESRAASVEIETRPNEGTLFRILIPKSVPLSRPVTRPAPSAAPKRILIVEDEREIGEALQVRLGNEGFQSSLLRDSRLAMKVLEAGTPFDLIITDLNMPHISGDTLARRIRRSRPDLPFILISSQAAFLNAGDLFAASLRKPINYDELVVAINELAG